MFARKHSFDSVCLSVIMVVLMVGCATQTDKMPAVAGTYPADQCLSCEAILPRSVPVTYLILHHTAAPLPSALEILRGKDPQHKVGIHYLVSDEVTPRVFKLAAEEFSTSHAGKSKWLNIKSMNQSSVGIEIVNLDGNTKAYPKEQISKVIDLSLDIVKRHQIPATNVLAHSDIAIGRKVDPGSNFPWKLLAESGVGAWPDDVDVARFKILYTQKIPSNSVIFDMLKTYGYQPENFSSNTIKSALEAFQRHFRSSKVNGEADTETVAILAALNFKYRKK
ncbi:MAG: N-acetylmuramoyl-L-alanine amidase [Opitutae bacterium]